MSQNRFQILPQVARVLEQPALEAVRHLHPAVAITEAVRIHIEQLRERIREGEIPDDDATRPETIARRAREYLEDRQRPFLRRVINATGVVLHTNLGRAPMAESAALAAYEAARGYLNLELSLETGARSSRQDAIREGVKRLTGAEAATAVNNCAAATILVLRALAAGKEVIVSRGQLVEIGGGFRIPEIMAVSGACLREVGTTNITRSADYEAAIGPNTALLMRIHTSNYRIRGFTKSTSLDELVLLGKKHSIPVIDDAGSGLAIDITNEGLDLAIDEPHIADGIRTGADLVLFSGDKLLGGPQSGLIAGRADLIRKIEKDPLMRAFRLDKMTLAALEATLWLYQDASQVRQVIPTLRMMTTPLAELRARCEQFASRLRGLSGLRSVEVKEDVAYVGGGSLADVALPTALVVLTAEKLSEDSFAQRLRSGTPAVVGRIQQGAVHLDLRTVLPGQDDDLHEAIAAALAVGEPS